MANTIGIDFGTTKTMVSYLNPATGRPELVRLGRDRDSIPTTVHEDESGAMLFGEDADDQIETDPEGYCRAFKLHLGENEPVMSRSDETAESLATRFLRHVKDECERTVFHGESVETATITVPVVFAPARKTALKRAAEAAGFKAVSFLPEPEAAGTAFLRDNPADKFSRALVLDWGGGTLDIAVISRDDDGTIHTDRHCAEGRDDVGGEEMDRGLLARLDEQWREAFGSPLRSSEENETRLLREAEKVKIGLSRKEVVAFRRGIRKIDVERARFEQDVSGLVDAAVGLVRSALRANEDRGGQPPDAIILIGGTSQVPVVRRAMEKNFPELRVLSWHHSHEAVALGATDLAGEQGHARVGNGASDVSVKMPDGVPKEFEPAWRMSDVPVSGLGSVKCRKAIPYIGFSTEDAALKMEKGLLVHRKRLDRFAVVPFPDDNGKPVDILTHPNYDEFDSDDGKAGLSNPYFEPLQKAFNKLQSLQPELSELQSEFDWFTSNSKDGYSAMRRNVSIQLAQCKKDMAMAVAELDRMQKEASKGFFAAIKSGWKEGGLKSEIANLEKTEKAKLEELNAIDSESKRHKNWPVSEKTKALIQKEDAYHEVYIEYCRVRHFCNRWKKEIEEERKVLDGLKAEISAMQKSAQQTAQKISDMEKRLPALKSQLAKTQAIIALKEKAHDSSSRLVESRARKLKEAFNM